MTIYYRPPRGLINRICYEGSPRETFGSKLGTTQTTLIDTQLLFDAAELTKIKKPIS